MKNILIFCLFQFLFVSFLNANNEIELIYDFKKAIGSDGLVYIRSIDRIEDTLWVCVYDKFETSYFFKSTDKGKTFLKINENKTSVMSGFIYNRKLYYLEYDNKYFSINDENKFEYFNLPEIFNDYGIHRHLFQKDDIILIHNSRNLMLSEDLKNWKRIYPDFSKYFNLDTHIIYIKSACVYNDSIFYLTCDLADFRNNYKNEGFFIMKSTNKGTDWSLISEIKDSTYLSNDIFVTENGCIFIAGYGYVYEENNPIPKKYELLVKSCDGGKNWDIPIGDKKMVSVIMYKLSFINNNIGYANGSALYITTSSGNEWKRYPDPLEYADNFVYFLFLDTNSLLIGTQKQGLLYKFSIQNIISVENELSIFNLSPNPATDFITINYDYEGNRASSPALIYDILGVKVAQEPLINGSNKINISHLTPGVYFIKIGDRVEKFIKI